MSMHVVAWVIGLGWFGFWMYWFIASTSAKSGPAQKGGSTQWRWFLGFRVALIVITLVLIHTRSLRGYRLTGDPVLWAAGLALWALGLGLAVWARLYIGRNWGLPMSRKDDPELVTSGPYTMVRHPIYSGVILALIGTAVALSAYWFMAVVLFGGYFIFSATREERYMTTVFPDSYPDYKRSTKMLIPFVL
jgi:protein-S-isoprenylcysteine O-methyltransferase Ste14